MKISKLSLIAAAICLSASFLASCSQPQDKADIRFRVITKDGTSAGLPADFFSAFGPVESRRALESGSAVISAPTETDEEAAQQEGVVRCRVYWLATPGAPELDGANTIRCLSGASVKASSGVRMYSLTGVASLLLQDFFVPLSERPERFVTKGGEMDLQLRTAAHAGEEEGWGGYIYDKSKVQRY